MDEQTRECTRREIAKMFDYLATQPCAELLDEIIDTVLRNAAPATSPRVAMTPEMDEDGHFPGCYHSGCSATRCADARAMRELGGLEYAAASSPATTVDRETQAIATAAATLLNEGARDAALELLSATRRR